MMHFFLPTKNAAAASAIASGGWSDQRAPNASKIRTCLTTLDPFEVQVYTAGVHRRNAIHRLTPVLPQPIFYSLFLNEDGRIWKKCVLATALSASTIYKFD